MKNEFVSYEIALALKELGFDEPCFAWYKNGKLRIELYWNISDLRDEDCISPTYSQVFRWFREKYKLHSKIEIQDVELDWYFYEILEVKNGRYNNDLHEDMNFKSYEEAEIACLRKLIEVVKKE